MNIQTGPCVNRMTKLDTKFTDDLWWRGGTWLIEMGPIISHPIETPPDIAEWMKENIRAWCRHSYKDIFLIKFRREIDVVAFKLRWYE